MRWRVALSSEVFAGLNQAAPCPLQSEGETRHQIKPVGMFERQDRGAAGIVIAQDGAGLVEGGRPRKAKRAKRALQQRHVKGNAATGAKRTVQKLDRGPTRGAKALAAAGLPAGNAKRRKQNI